jgi:hypothetical protein
MIKNYIGYLSFFIALSFGGSGPTVYAQTLPLGIKSHLDSNYPGWKFDSERRSRDSFCGPEVAHGVVSGYFNNDKNRDYAVKFVKGRNGYVIAFLARGSDYNTFVLQSTSASDLRSTVLGLGRKGEKYPIGGDIPDLTYGRLPNDAPYTIPCASDAVAFYVYKNGRFQ